MRKVHQKLRKLKRKKEEEKIGKRCFRIMRIMTQIHLRIWISINLMGLM